MAFFFASSTAGFAPAVVSGLTLSSWMGLAKMSRPGSIFSLTICVVCSALAGLLGLFGSAWAAGGTAFVTTGAPAGVVAMVLYWDIYTQTSVGSGIEA